MAVVSPFGVGGPLVSAGTATLPTDYALTEDNPFFTEPLQNERMPRVFVWVRHVAGADPITFWLEFTVTPSPLPGPVTGADRWLPLTAPTALAVGAIVSQEIFVPSIKVRLVFQRTAGSVAGVQSVLACAGTS